MSRKRCLSDLEGTHNLEPSHKRRRIENKDESALLTIQISGPSGYRPLSYKPCWICGNSTKTKLHSDVASLQYIPFTPSQFVTTLKYPFVRFCNIPYAQFPADWSSRFYDFKTYKYHHSLCINHEIIDRNEIIKFISNQINLFQSDCANIIGKTMNIHGVALCHLFMMKEYINIQNNEWYEIIKSSESSKLALPIDIIQYTLSEYIYDVQINKDIDYLNHDANINQIKWFEYMFYFIQFASKQWQIFCYEHILKNGTYNAVIINLMQRYRKLAFREFEYPLLTEFCLKLCPYKWNTSMIGKFIKYAITMKQVDLFQVILNLFHSNSIKPSVFWGKLLFDVVESAENEQLSLFNKLCFKMKEHCNGNTKIIKASFDKFNTKFCDPVKHTNYDKAELKCIEIMQNILDYDIHTMIPYCCLNRNIVLISYFIQHNCFDFNLCKNKYSDQIKKLPYYAQNLFENTL